MFLSKIDMTKTLFRTKWLSLKRIKTSEYEYIYSHETRCNGKIIAILPYQITPQGIQFLVRNEITPAWGKKLKIRCAITGGVKYLKSQSAYTQAELTAIDELKEETGYTINKEELINLSTSCGTKSTDTIYYLYSVNLSNKLPGEITTNDPLEKLATNQWITENIIKYILDPLVSLMYIRLLSNIKRPINIEKWDPSIVNYIETRDISEE